MTIESDFDVGFVAKLTSEEKQIQQNYRPIIGVHKWFARRPGALFRSLILSEFGEGPLAQSYFQPHDLHEITIADPFMGGGTSLYEANRTGANVAGCDINSMAYWIVRQELAAIDRIAFRREAERILEAVGKEVSSLYRTKCTRCCQQAAVKYFLWVKCISCAACGDHIDLFPGYLVAENVRHPFNVVHCPHCRELVEFPDLQSKDQQCPNCKKGFDWSAGTARRNRYTCRCGHQGKYPAELREKGAPEHRLFGIEYHCTTCRDEHKGRFFKAADASDLRKFATAAKRAPSVEHRWPDEKIPDGDETKRLHRWGYTSYREMFNSRQLLTLGLLAEEISCVQDDETRHGLATVFSDFLRYQNMLCRYDTYALKCQDIFSVHGFPVGLVQCENNVLGIPKIGSGSFVHFIEKYDRAKAYCEAPFETVKSKTKKRIISVEGETIAASFVDNARGLKGGRKALIRSASIEALKLRKNSLDAVFTDPPYFDNVQYAELMDFCFVWLRRLLPDVNEFQQTSTRSERELTGNTTTGKDLAHFTHGLSQVFVTVAEALKQDAPFAFTYHHNRPDAYAPIVVAILNARLACTASIPCPAEMSASLHISGTNSSVIDNIFVCRTAVHASVKRLTAIGLRDWLSDQRAELRTGGIKCTKGDLRCMALGRVAQYAVNSLAEEWDTTRATAEQLQQALGVLLVFWEAAEGVVDQVLEQPESTSELAQARLFD